MTDQERLASVLDFIFKHGQTGTYSGKAETECLWLSPRTTALDHMPLFSVQGEADRAM